MLTSTSTGLGRSNGMLKIWSQMANNVVKLLKVSHRMAFSIDVCVCVWREAVCGGEERTFEEEGEEWEALLAQGNV